MITLRKIRVVFDKRVVLDGVDLDIEDHLSTVILGRSGVGKSVLLKVILGLVPQESGSITIDGQDLKTLPPRNEPI